MGNGHGNDFLLILILSLLLFLQTWGVLKPGLQIRLVLEGQIRIQDFS